jgi:hypothetical protein
MSSAIVATSTRPFSNEETITESLNSCDFWLDMSDSSKFTLSSATRVSGITDKSPSPKTISINNAIVFDPVRKSIMPNGTGSLDYLTIGLRGAVTGTGGDSSETLFFVCYIHQSGSTAILGQSATASRGIRLGTTNLEYLRVNSSGSVNIPVTNPVNRLFVASFVWTNSRVTMYLNGHCIGTTATVTFTGLNVSQTIFTCPGVGSFNGGLCECIIYQRGLTTTQINNINQYLATKWRISTSSIIASPLSLSGVPCNLWLDGNDASTITFSSGTSVSQWSDKSGNGYHATQGTVSKQPTYNSTIRGLKFTSSTATGFLTTAPWSATETVFVVVDILTTTVGAIIGTTSSGGRLLRFRTTNGFIQNGGTILITLRHNAYLTTIRYLLTYINDVSGNSFQINVNSLQDTERTTALSYTAGTFNNVIGGSTSTVTGTYDSNIYEVIVFNSALSGDNRMAIEKYLTNKWSILNTPITTSYPYPFFNTRPFTTSFSPFSISGCLAWYDAADPSTVTLTGGTISSVADKSGNGNNLTGGVGFTYNQTKFNGIYPSFFSSSRTSTNSIGSSTGSFSQPLTIIAVARSLFENIGGESFLFDSTSSTTGITVNHFYNTGPMILGIQMRNASTNTGSIGYTGTSDISVFPISGSLSRIFVNGSDVVVAGSGGAGTLTGPILGTNRLKTSSYHGHICEVLIYNRFISQNERQAIESYLSQKWGLVSVLPGGHPGRIYKPLSTNFDPRQVGFCGLWLDAADVSTMTFSGTNVTTWRDKVATFALTGSTPYTSISNRPAVQFTGGTTLSAVNFPYASVCTSNQNFTTFLVQTTRSTTGVNSVPFGLQNTAIPSTRMFIFVSSTGGFFVDAGTQGSPRLFSATNFTVNVPQIIVTYRSGSNIVYRKNGAQDSSSSSGGNSFSSNTYTASISDSTGVWTGEMYEVIHFSNILTNEQIRQIEGYLAHKWGLVDLLPSTHQFKKVRP